MGEAPRRGAVAARWGPGVSSRDGVGSLVGNLEKPEHSPQFRLVARSTPFGGTGPLPLRLRWVGARRLSVCLSEGCALSCSGCWLRGAHIPPRSMARCRCARSGLTPGTGPGPGHHPLCPPQGWGDSPTHPAPHFLEASWSQGACGERQAFQKVPVAGPRMSLGPSRVTPGSSRRAAGPGGGL